MFESLIAALPLLLAAVVPPIVAGLRATIAGKIHGTWLPILIPITAGLLTGIANLSGLPLGLGTSELEVAPIPVWESVFAGLLIGLGGLGVHRIKRQVSGEPA